MCDEQKNLQSLAARVATNIAKTVEKLFPAVGESLVSILCWCVQKINLSCLLNLCGQINIVLCEKHVNFRFLFSQFCKDHCTHSFTYFGCQ
jgi:hypothetical protein